MNYWIRNEVSCFIDAINQLNKKIEVCMFRKDNFVYWLASLAHFFVAIITLGNEGNDTTIYAILV